MENSKPINSVNELMSRKDAAAYLNISPLTLASWKSKGRYNIPVIKVGRLAKYKLSDLESFIANRTVRNDN